MYTTRRFHVGRLKTPPGPPGRLLLGHSRSHAASSTLCSILKVPGRSKLSHCHIVTMGITFAYARAAGMPLLMHCHSHLALNSNNTILPSLALTFNNHSRFQYSLMYFKCLLSALVLMEYGIGSRAPSLCVSPRHHRCNLGSCNGTPTSLTQILSPFFSHLICS